MGPRRGRAATALAGVLAVGVLGLGVLGLAAGASCGRGGGEREILVFAAASTTDAMTELAAAFESETGTAVSLAFGGSHDLARQIAAGAPADLFLAADRASMERLERDGFVRRGEVRDLLSNQLVVIVPATSALAIRGPGDLAGAAAAAGGLIAIADPEAVPAGAYARQWLGAAGVWEDVEPRVVPTLDVRAALGAVETGNAPLGIVYRSDAARSGRVRIAYEVPPGAGPPILYPAAPLAAAEPADGSRRFAAFLASAAARRVFERHGFVVL